MTDQASTTTTTGLLAAGPPEPPAERVAAIRETLGPDVDPAEFGEAARAALLQRIDRLLAEARAGDLTDAAGMLAHGRDRLNALEPGDLTPRRGLAGWFDSRKGRLKRFRAAYGDTARVLSAGADDIDALSGGMARRLTSLDEITAEIRAAITELDAWIVAGLGWAGERATPIAEAAVPETPHEAVADAANDTTAEDEPTEVLAAEAVFPEPLAAETTEPAAEAAPSDEAAVEPFPVAPETYVPATPVEPEAAEPFPLAEDAEPAPAEAAPLVEGPDAVEAETPIEATADDTVPVETPDVEAAPMADPAPAEGEAEAVAEETVAGEAVVNDPTAEAQPAETDDDREALARRLAVLVASRNAALRQLPLARVVQNAGWRTPERLKATTAALAEWRETWKADLGLQGRRPRKVRPDVVGLRETRDRATAALDAAQAEVAAARERRAEAVARMEAAAEQARRPA